MATTPDDALDRLHRAGWSVGEIGFNGTWFVSGSNGENVIKAEGASQAEVWKRACDQAAADGMLGPERAEQWTR